MPERNDVYPEVCGTCRNCLWCHDENSKVVRTICKHDAKTMNESTVPIMIVSDSFLHVCDEYKSRRFTAKKGKAVA